ncbi:MAG: DUF92 domain-containing protein [Gemmatimonadales bacterium]|nr:DUF92 domain-containing protein [Gemmatimonadales bacterium]NIN12844.1 DUF92 domain-containing protein [Gemmatimonadales bacterium]NIN51022.1 DUF92 domain-containing protein [Gemmatimonadales bacterium]NIP08486.1 DUF92 domain-containing protein [Gemmatimonadales bacterium]NIR02526.1 DUF92 domain-containing protein [Gemmatimonadales bacterium]
MTPAAAVVLAGGLALVGRTIGWLTPGGALAAALVGALILVGGGVAGAALLALFFISSSVLTYAVRPLPQVWNHREAGGRNARQVLANGSWAALGAVLVTVQAAAGWPLLTGALAAAQADTWATEIGMRSRRAPRLITSGRPVPAGTSGGVTALGTFAAVAGAGATGIVAAALGVPPHAAAAAVVGGTAGMLGDSILGATVQGVFHCESCATETEHALHRCGIAARPVRGWRSLGNNAVNFVATGVGGLVAVAVWFLL